MSPKQIKEAPEPRSNNIKNIYIQKINSLMKLSKDTIGKSQIEALNQTNRNKIKKHLSEGTQKNNIRLQKNRQSAKKARQRKKIYVKLLQQQEKRLACVLQKTQNVQKISSEYVQLLSEKKKSVTMNQERGGNNEDKIVAKNKPPGKELIQKVQDKINLLKQIVQELTQLSKYAYWKESKPEQSQSQNGQQNPAEQDFFNIQEVLADIQVVHVKNSDNFDMNLDDLLNVPYQDESQDDQMERFDIKSLIADQYETVSRCLHELESINSEAQEILKNSHLYTKDLPLPAQDYKNHQLAEFKKKNTIVPQYQIKKVMPRRIDSFNSLSSANRSIMSKNRSLFSLNNYFINMEQAETKILSVDRAIQQINRILAFRDQEQKQQRDEQFSIQRN